MMNKLLVVKDTLLKVTNKVYHYEKNSNAKDKYIVWSEDGEADSLHACNQKVNQAIEGTIDYFTLEEFDENVQKIQDKLNEANISFTLIAIDYEDETKLIHYHWVFEV